MNNLCDTENGDGKYRFAALLRSAPSESILGETMPKQDESVRFPSDSPETGEITRLSTLNLSSLRHSTPPALAEAHTFLPRLAEHYLTRQQFPAIQEIAVLFVDIADSTSTILQQPPEVALALVQRFMSLVTEMALAHCGDVKDYEGDGALLYFGSVEQATRAALAIRAALSVALEEGSLPFQARLSVNVGKVIIGVIGAPLRRSVALIGPTVSLASRLLKHIPPGGIIAPQTAVEKLREEAPDLAEWFQVWGECLTLKGFEEECVTAYHLAPSIVATEGSQILCNEKFSALSSSRNRADLLSAAVQ
jgi:class 3 adenylate cyclase